MNTGNNNHLQNDDGLSILLHNFLMTLRRSKHRMNSLHKEVDSNFIKTVKKLVQYRQKPPKPEKLKKFYDEVADPSFLTAEKPWLLEKISEIPGFKYYPPAAS